VGLSTYDAPQRVHVLVSCWKTRINSGNKLIWLTKPNQLEWDLCGWWCSNALRAPQLRSATGEPVPRISTLITNSIVYLYPDKESAETGADIGASGFILGEKSALVPKVSDSLPPKTEAEVDFHRRSIADFKAAMDAGDSQAAKALANSNEETRKQMQWCSHVYVVTNKHVIAGKNPNPVVRINLKHPGSGFERTMVLDFKVSDWVTDPENDLAVCMLPPDFNVTMVEFTVLDRGFVMTEEEFRREDYGPGDSVVYVGRFMEHAGKYENMPSVRFGNISMNPNEREPVVYDTDDATRMSQVGFLVEARSRSGYSGSPVFTLQQHVINRPRAVIPWMDMRLLGVDWGHLPERVLLQDPRGYFHGSRWYVEVHAGMMGVVPAWRLLEFIDKAPRLIERREQDDVWYLANAANAIPGLVT
jgi:hypothetical protein